MDKFDANSVFNTRLLRPKKMGESLWAFIVLPHEVSDMLPRRGRTSVTGELNGQPFTLMLEPDGNKSHWLRINETLMRAAGVSFGDLVELKVAPVTDEPEPAVPRDLQQALDAAPAALDVWQATTTLARVDWIHWVESAKQAKTRAKRIDDACDMLASGKKRVCCFDPSGFYSKALKAPEADG
ncbi:YdeI/OmpD-associated family protein [uncultured Gilvimarinus sp.]|uniref:YdeI/OmpD-associated family protein n=1 Tax=uncultured Gilvimarinus sp. TaxID=1689143 RepID=UPI0030EE63CE|tara:strand:- start:6384 stop:6932 length:549 start_codon:yes stop_codon:yes gene_type:complete